MEGGRERGGGGRERERARGREGGREGARDLRHSFIMCVCVCVCTVSDVYVYCPGMVTGGRRVGNHQRREVCVTSSHL
jgi:hypothetical protein